MKRSDPVAVAGIGCISAAGPSLNRNMASLFAGIRNPAPPTQFSVQHPFTLPVFEIVEDFYRPEQFARHDMLRTCRLALTATAEALDDAGLEKDIFNRYRTGVCLGTNVGSSMNNEAFYQENTEGCNPYVPPIHRFLISNPTAAVAREYAATGPSHTVVNACSAGSDAIGMAASWIRAGICDLAITGGADELYRVTYSGFKSLLIHDDAPCRPFDINRAGLNLGEGAAVFILASQSILRRLNRSARARLLAYGSATDAFHFTKPRPDGMGLKRAITEALQFSGVDAGDISFVNVHGTGTLDNDRVESHVLNELMPQTPFFSSKGYTGHTLGASGAIEAAFCVACLEKQMIPASIGLTDPDPELPLMPVTSNTAINGSRTAMSQTLAFGGNNAVLILEAGGNGR